MGGPFTYQLAQFKLSLSRHTHRLDRLRSNRNYTVNPVPMYEVYLENLIVICHTTVDTHM